MKTKLIPILLAVICASVWLVRSATVQTAGGLVTVSSTTSNFTSVAFTNRGYPKPQFAISHGALTATNDLPVLLQFSVDNTNWITVATYRPAGTAATNSEQWIPTLTNQVNYWRVSVTTTNAVDVGIISQY